MPSRVDALQHIQQRRIPKHNIFMYDAPAAATDPPCTHQHAGQMRAWAQVLQAMPEEARLNLTPLKLRRKARDFALKTVDAQRTAFKRWAHPGRLHASTYLC